MVYFNFLLFSVAQWLAFFLHALEEEELRSQTQTLIKKNSLFGLGIFYFFLLHFPLLNWEHYVEQTNSNKNGMVSTSNASPITAVF